MRMCAALCSGTTQHLYCGYPHNLVNQGTFEGFLYGKKLEQIYAVTMLLGGPFGLDCKAEPVGTPACGRLIHSHHDSGLVLLKVYTSRGWR